MALDQLMAFCVSTDQDRQRQVFEQIGPHTPAYASWRAMTGVGLLAVHPQVRNLHASSAKTPASRQTLRFPTT